MHVFFFREAWRSLRQHRGLTLTAVLSLTAALTLSGLFLLLTHNAQVAMNLIGDRREMIVYLRDEVTDSQREALLNRLRELYGIPTYVTREQAWEEFKQQVGDPALLDAVGENPLPASVRVRLKPELLHYEAMEQAAEQVSQFPEVEGVRYGADWVRRLDDLSAALRNGAIAVGVTVALAIIFVIYNTIRLTVLARRPQVEIMSRLGATDGFISTPFVIEAAIQAGASALLALAALFALHRAVASFMVGTVFLPVPWAGAFFAAAMGLAWVAAALALSRVLRAVGP